MAVDGEDIDADAASGLVGADGMLMSPDEQGKSYVQVLREQKYFTMLVRPRPTAGRLRTRFRAVRSRSYASPLYPNEDRPPLDEGQPLVSGELNA